MPKPRVSPCVRRKFRYLSVCLCAQVFVNHPTFNTESYRIVTDKYLHPLWNPTTRVADLVLLKLRSNLPAYKTVIMPVILDNHLSKKPDILQFKGFGKINEDGNSVWMHGSTSMDDNNMLRSLKIEQWNSNVNMLVSRFYNRAYYFALRTPKKIALLTQYIQYVLIMSIEMLIFRF